MNYEKDFLSDKSDDALLEELRRVAKSLGKKTVTQADLKESGHVGIKAIINRFGSWNNALERAGLEISMKRNLSDAAILAEIGRIWNELGRRPMQDEFAKMGAFSTKVLVNRYGSFLKAIDAFIAGQTIAQPAMSPDTGEVFIEQALHTPTASIRKRSEAKYGPLINFRGMQHAPLNELGVVFVFGMLAKELGFTVEAIGASFPDCEAKRLEEDGRCWKRVMIEFEYASSSFLKHGHDVGRCDLIVCWTHDWKDCPIEVLELSKIVRGQDAV